MENLENKKSFLDEIKSIFQFFKGYHLLKKIKNSGHKIKKNSHSLHFLNASKKSSLTDTRCQE